MKSLAGKKTHRRTKISRYILLLKDSNEKYDTGILMWESYHR